MEANIEMRDDLIVGTAEISKFLGIPVRNLFYCFERRYLPAFKIGKLWAIRKSTFARWLAEQENVAISNLDREP